MKRTVLFLLALSSMMAFAACGIGGDGEGEVIVDLNGEWSYSDEVLGNPCGVARSSTSFRAVISQDDGNNLEMRASAGQKWTGGYVPPTESIFLTYNVEGSDFARNTLTGAVVSPDLIEGVGTFGFRGADDEHCYVQAAFKMERAL